MSVTEEILETGSGWLGLDFSSDSAKALIAQMQNGDYTSDKSETSLSSHSLKSATSLSAMSSTSLWVTVTEETETQTQSSRDLFKSSGGDNPGLRQRRDKEAMVSEYSNVTDSLTAISRQLAETVERSKLTVGNLEGTSKAVDELGDEYRMMGGVVGQSRKLITKYARREFTDKILIAFALAFFFAVVLYILRKRLFPSFGPIEIIMYLLGLSGNIFSSISSLWS